MRKSTKKRYWRRLLRYIFFLLLVFCLAYFLSGGTKLFSPHTWQAAGDFLPRLEQQPPAIAQSGQGTPPSATDRLSRILFLKRAVNSRINADTYVKLNDIPDSMQSLSRMAASTAITASTSKASCGLPW